MSRVKPRKADCVYRPSRVVYHRGLHVNDFRYLATGMTLTLDWDDPWSRISSRNMAAGDSYRLMPGSSADSSGFDSSKRRACAPAC